MLGKSSSDSIRMQRCGKEMLRIRSGQIICSLSLDIILCAKLQSTLYGLGGLRRLYQT